MSLLLEMTRRMPTELWCDGCEPRTLARSLERGATGATSNPVIVMQAIEADRGRWDEITRALVREHPSEDEEQIAWRLVSRVTREGAAQLQPIFERSSGVRGWISVQASPRAYRSARRMIEQASELAAIAPNVAVKLPTCAAGLVAMEELTARGVAVNATVSFSVPQAIAAAEAIERGLARREARAGGGEPAAWVTIMAGRIDDHLRELVKQRALPIALDDVRHASTAIVRRAYRAFRARGYRAKLLVAAMRSHHHWSEFLGGELVVTIPPEWQERFDASGVELRPRIDDEVDPRIVAELAKALPDFERAYEEAGMSAAEFESFGASTKTLRQFLGALDRLVHHVRDAMLSSPTAVLQESAA